MDQRCNLEQESLLNQIRSNQIHPKVTHVHHWSDTTLYQDPRKPQERGITTQQQIATQMYSVNPQWIYLASFLCGLAEVSINQTIIFPYQTHSIYKLNNSSLTHRKTHTHTHARTHTHTHTQACTHTQSQTHRHMHRHTHTCKCTHLHTCTHAVSRTYKLTCIKVCLNLLIV